MKQKLEIKRKSKSSHSPTLNTVLMVESALRDSGKLLTVAQIKKIVPKKIMHQTLHQILDYLQYSGKIIIGTKGVLWIYTPKEKLEELMNKGTEL